MTVILGINSYHGDASACLLRDGKLIAAAEEERFRRIKHWAGFPSEAIRYCMEEAGASLESIDHVAINHDAKANLWKKVSFTLTKRPELSLVLDRIRNKREQANVEEELLHTVGAGFRGKIHHVEHHLAHLSSAFLVSPFEEAVVVSVDGFGDFASAAWGIGRGGNIEIEEKVFFPHSLGIFYEALTQYLGFPNYGDEYKVMGLAPYGESRFLEQMRKIVLLDRDGTYRLDLGFFRHHMEKVAYEWEGGAPSVGQLFAPALENLLGPARKSGDDLTQRHKDIARSIQAMYEEAFLNLLNSLYRRHRLDALALAGGCGMNSVANGKILANTPFKRLYVQSAAGDAGGAIGAAFQVWHSAHCAGTGADGFRRRFHMDHAYWGPQFSAQEIGSLLEVRRAELSAAKCQIRRIDDEVQLCQETAEAIAAGKVIGWFQGRMEWGPRALGNRSILCDPRRGDMKDILNVKIKRRESFRPFAPSILRESVPEWFETDDDVPFMMQVYPIRKEKRALIPAVTHVDGSGRLQTVQRDTSPRYYRLIEQFCVLTGVPMLLNTSFNENEPVVCRPEEALNCFLRTQMDVLVLGDFVISR
ncbi:MAG: carbamoyltransferase [Proteobacteria bacterium]|nr:carbamoyltransferase [Pseudomonadota bacterium]